MNENQEYNLAFSVCIPVYNTDVRKLVLELHRQASSMNCPFEILLIDDGSTVFKEENRQLQQLPNLSSIELKENIGRAKIRNLLAKTAQYPYLIFMDCDACVFNASYIRNYFKEIPADVVIGGCSYSPIPPVEKEFLLRWKYGVKREARPAEKRKNVPYRSFATFNFLIKKEIFNRIKFDEKISGYGHEDTLFGWTLKKQRITINHIDNPLIHIVSDNTEDFLKKTENSVKNLWHIYRNIPEKEEFMQDNSLLKQYVLIQKYGLSGLLSLFFNIFRSLIYKNLLSTYPQIRFLDLYKLGMLNMIHLQKIPDY